MSDSVLEAEQRYRADQVLTATPARRLLMLFERALADLSAAGAAFESGAIESIHEHLVHAQEIVLALHDGVSTEGWEAGATLRQLYLFVHERLVWCNVHKDASLLPACAEVLGRLYEANREAARIEEAAVVA